MCIETFGKIHVNFARATRDLSAHNEMIIEFSIWSILELCHKQTPNYVKKNPQHNEQKILFDKCMIKGKS